MASETCFTDLPDELLLKIFSYLNTEDLAMSVQHVNSHWKNVSQHASLWKNQTFSPECKMSTKKIARYLMNMPALQAFCPNGGTNTKVIDTLCKYCRDIRRLQLNYYNTPSNYRLHEILKKIPHLENLSIPLPKETDHQLHFANLVGQFQKLRILTFMAYSSVVDGVLRAIADGCPSLQSLDIGFGEYHNQDIEYFLQKKGQQLSSFSFRGCISTVAHRLLTECANLEYLFYEHYNEDLPSTYIHSLSKLSKMRDLTLVSIIEGQTRDVSTIFKKQALSKLITLNIYYCGDFDGTSLTVILTNCPQLQSLTVQDCDVLTDYGFQYIGTCKNLQFLDISGCSVVTDKSMEYVGAECPQLNHLDISHCYELTNKGVEYICSGCQRLKYLGIQKCPKMTDDVMKNIFRCKKLEILNLSCNYELLGIHFLLIPSNLVHLTKLHVFECLSLDGKRMDKLKEEMPHLLIVGYHTNNEETDVNLGDATFFISQLL
jgi:hypothetical protein